jgi:DNA polymerase I
MEARVRLVQLKTENGLPYVIDAIAVDVDDLLQALADKHLIVHNAVYDLAVLKKNFGYEHHGPVTCTMLTAQVLYGGTNKKAGLQDLLERNLKIEISKEEQTAEWFGELSNEMLQYAACDVMHLHVLWEDLAQRIQKSNAGLDWTVDLENRMSKVTAGMLVSGMPVSEEVLTACIEESRVTAEVQLSKLDEFVKDALPEKFLKANRTNKKVPEDRREKVNWNSPPQMIWAFDTIADLQLESTSKDLLAEVEHPLADAVTEYRKALDVYKRFRNTKVTNGRIHAKWNQLKAKTGRMSCENPPLQGIPPSLRKAFVAPKGHKLVVSDLSQIEIRILAVLSGDENLREEFLAGNDVHRSVAAKILGKKHDNVTSEERRLAKSLVFGLLYGMSLYGFATRVKTIYKRVFSEEEIKEKFWDPFFEAYPKVKKWRNKTVNSFANGNRVAFTPHGRRRLNLETDRQALNTPIQAGALDVMKSIAVAIYERRSAAPGPVEVVGLVHDEIIIVTSEKAVEAVAGWVDAIMKEVGEEVANYGVEEDHCVPIDAGTAVCSSWAEKE